MRTASHANRKIKWLWILPALEFFSFKIMSPFSFLYQFGGLLPLQAAVTLPYAESAAITEILLQYGADPNCEEEAEEIKTCSCKSLSSSAASIYRPTSASGRETASSVSTREEGRRGEVPDKRGEAPDRRGEVPDRRGEVPDRRGEAPDRRGEVPDRRGEVPDRRGEVPDRKKGGRDMEKEDGKIESLDGRSFSTDGEGVLLIAGDNWGSSGFSPLHLVCAMSGPDTKLVSCCIWKCFTIVH